MMVVKKGSELNWVKGCVILSGNVSICPTMLQAMSPYFIERDLSIGNLCRFL